MPDTLWAARTKHAALLSRSWRTAALEDGGQSRDGAASSSGFVRSERETQADAGLAQFNSSSAPSSWQAAGDVSQSGSRKKSVHDQPNVEPPHHHCATDSLRTDFIHSHEKIGLRQPERSGTTGD